MFLTTSLAYGLSRTNFPGGKLIFYAVLLTMLFNGGIVPLYLLMLQLGLTKNIWSVILAYGVNTFYFIITRTYMTTLPESLIESAKIDGADEWRILFKIVLPLSKPILATVLLFYAVDRWNEWFNAMVFLRRNDLIPLQLVLRTIVMDSVIVNSLSIAGPRIPRFTEGIQTATIIVTMLPIMCFFPFLQKYFIKGIMIGAIKA
jgi:putative aldouronate transport system permease protein